MWFKNITFYPINTKMLPENETLLEKIATKPFAPPLGLDWFSEGFVPMMGEEMAFFADFTWSVALQKSERVLPSPVIRDALNEKIVAIELAENRQISRKEKQELKEQVTDDLLPRAFCKNSLTHAVVDTKHGFLLVNGSGSRAENLLSKLREVLGGLDARLPNTVHSPSSLMTDWLLRGAADGGFELDDSCELQGSGDVVPIVKVSKQDLTADEITQHVKNGKIVTQLGLVWREQIAFVLTDDFALKRIRYLDVLQDEAEQHGDDAANLAFATQILMSESIGTMIEELVGLLGGWTE